MNIFQQKLVLYQNKPFIVRFKRTDFSSAQSEDGNASAAAALPSSLELELLFQNFHLV